MKFSIIVEARLGSKRLPGKILYKIKKHVFLEYLINRLKLSSKAKEIIVATTNLKSDYEIVRIAKKNKVKYYRGSEDNVLQRLLDTGKKFNCDGIVRITSDCPIIDVSLIDQAIETFKNNKCDYLSNANIRSFPDGMDIEIFTLKTLKKSSIYANSKKSREWPTSSIRKKPNIFKHLNILAPPELHWPKLGLTLDVYQDYKLLKKIIIYFNERYDFSCLDVVRLLKRKKNLLKLNKNVKRNS